MNIGALSKVDQLEVQVHADKAFSVVLAGTQLNGLDALFAFDPGGALARTVEAVASATRSYEDAQRAKKFRAAIAEIDLQSLTQKTLVDGLQASLRFKSVTAATERPEPSPTGAGILRVQIDNWGLYADSVDNARLHKVQVGLNATASLIGGDGTLVWRHSDYFTGGEHRPIDDYVSSPDLLKSNIEEAVTGYSARVVNEIRYAN